MAGTQRDIQQLIQSLVPSGVNNGNPNTVYNTAATPYGGTQRVPLPPMQDAQGNWFMNSVSNAANIDPRMLTTPGLPGANVGPAWQAPSSLQARLPTWPTPFDPAQYGSAGGGGAPVTGGPAIPSTPVVPPAGGDIQGQPGGGANPFDPNGGTGGYDGCVVIESYLEDYERADDVQFGDTMLVIDPVTFKRSTGEVSYSETKLMPCVRITTESGIELECSTTAPIADELGQQVKAPDLLNKLIPVYDNGSFYLDRVASIEDLGEKEVRHITVENNFFLAGKEKGRYIFHHNMKLVPGLGQDIIGMYAARDAQFGWGRDMGGFGAESMGTMTANTRASNRAANANYTPTGQGLIDAFGEVPQENGIASAPNPWAQSNLPAYDSSWFQEQQAYNNSLSNLGQLAPGSSPEAPEGGFWNTIDNKLLGDVYNQETGKMNWGNLLSSIVEFGTGIPVNSGRMAMGTSNLMNEGSGTSADYARNQLRNTYNYSTPEQKAQLVSTLSEKYKMTEQQVLERIGVKP